MKIKTLALIKTGLALVLNACSPFTVVKSSGTQPTPEQGNIPFEMDVNGTPTSYVPPATPLSSDQGIDEMNYFEIEHVDIEVGIGSPLPVEIVVSGTWPDLCAQIADGNSTIKDFNIDITILASTAPTCRPDYLGLPFLLKLPLNIGEVLAGTYSISVDGASTTLEMPIFP